MVRIGIRNVLKPNKNLVNSPSREESTSSAGVIWNTMTLEHQITFHEPILLNESIQMLLTDRSGTYVDGTLGGGGHAEAVLKKLRREGRLIGIDRDDEAIAQCRQRLFSYGDRVSIVQGEIGEVDRLLDDMGVSQISGFLLDLGVSSHQIETVERGFSYLSNGPLDMRMDTSSTKSASDVINHYSEKDLTDIFSQYGEERRAHRIARRIVERRKRETIETTGELADIVRRVTPYRQQIKTLSRIWQGIRFEVNDELEQLRMGLEKVYSYLKIDGRIVVISYESLMDRMVKRFLRGEYATFMKKELPIRRPNFKFRVLTRRVIRPTEEEVRQNPRARSARLRIGEKIGEA